MAITCPNKSSIEWKYLVDNIGTHEAYALFIANDNDLPSLDVCKEYVDTFSKSKVKYSFKAVDILLSDKAKQVFDKGNKNNWSLDKILSELNVPKEQKQLLLDIGSKDREQLAVELVSKYGYNVEVNTAMDTHDGSFSINPYTEFIYEGSTFIRDSYGVPLKDGVEIDNTYFNRAMTAAEKLNATEDTPSQHYSNLTVPGGINYTENEISTPLIIPSIKGHAQFSTDQGIGWFRSDESSKNTKERRILEIQSDLFQKGRTADTLINTKESFKEYLVSPEGYADLTQLEDAEDRKLLALRKELNNPDLTYREALEYVQKTSTNFGKPSQNQFLQLLNKDNNWVTFFIKSIIQDSAKKGYEKVLFPKGETAAKIEGHETIADEVESINHRINELSQQQSIDAYSTISAGSVFQPSARYNDDYNEELRKKKEQYKDKYIVVERSIGADGRVYGVNLPQTLEDITLYESEEEAKKEAKRRGSYKNNEIKELEQRKQELKSQGIEKLKPIEAFYEIKVTNVLKKLGIPVTEVTDEYGNKWNEITPVDTIISLNYGDRSSTVHTEESVNAYTERILSKLPGIKQVQWVDESELDDVLSLLAVDDGINTSKVNAFTYGGVAYLVKGRVTPETGIEEVLHPFVDALKVENPKLYDKLLNEVYLSKDLAWLRSKVVKNYQGFKQSYINSELITQALSVVTKKELDLHEEHSFKELVNRFWSWLADFFNSLFTTPDGTKIFKVEELKEHFTLKDIATILNTKGVKIESHSDYVSEVKFNVADEVTNKLKNATRSVQLNNTGTKYVNTDTGKTYTRVSEAMSKIGYKGGTNDETLADLGKDIHTELSNVILDTTTPTTKFKMSDVAKSQLAAIGRDIKRTSVEVLSEQTLIDDEKGIAGTADVISIDKHGIPTVWDMKTSLSGSRFVYYNSRKYSNHTSREKDALQMSIYASMIAQTTGVKTDAINVIKAVPVVENDIITRFDKLEVETLPVNKDYKLVTAEGTEFEFADTEPKSKLEDIVDVGIKVLEDRLFSLQKSKDLSITEVDRTQKILEELKTERVNEAVVKIGKYVGSSIKKEHTKWKEFIKEVEDGKVVLTPQMLYRFKDVAESYMFLNDLLALTDVLEGSLSSEEKQNILALDIENSIRLRDEIIRGYKLLGTRVLSKILAEQTNYTEALYKEKYEREFNSKLASTYKDSDKRAEARQQYINEKLAANKELIEKEHKNTIERELQQASDDVGYLSRWLSNIMDSPDLIVGAVAKMIAEATYKTRQESLSKHEELLHTLRKLEKELDKGAFTDLTKFYDMFLEKDAKGNPTGYLIDKFNSSLRTEYYELVETEKAKAEQAILKNPKEEDTIMSDYKKKIYDWKQRVAPLNRATFNKAKLEHLKSLVDAGVLKESDYEYYSKHIDSLSIPANWEAAKSTDLVSQLFADYVDRFIYTNAWNYREVADEYKDKYENKDFKKLEEIRNSNPNDIRVLYYDTLVDMRNEADLALPMKERLGFRLPGIEASPMENALKEGKLKSKISNWFEAVRDDFGSVRPDDETVNFDNKVDAYGNRVWYLPTRFTRSVDPSKQSYDLSTIYFKYWQSAMDYKNKLEIQPAVEMARYMINNRTAIKRDGNGNPIYNITSKFFTVLNSKMATTPKGEKTNTAQQFNDVVAALMYGDRNQSMGTVNIFGKTYDISKMLDALSRYTGMNALAFNPVVGLSNILTGETLQKIEAHFGKYVSTKSYWKANWMYDKELATGNLVTDIGSRNPKSVINLLAYKFDALNERVQDVRYRKNTVVANLASQSTLYATMSMGEHWMQSRLMLSMLNDIKAVDSTGKPILRADGKEASILDLYSAKDGKLVFDSKGGTVANWSESDQFKFQQKLKAVQTQLHGAFGELEYVAIQRNAVGRMLYQFRKFIQPGIKRRFGKKAYNNRLDEFNEGSYRTFGRYISNLMSDIKSAEFAVASNEWNNLTENEKANVKKTVAEIGVTALLFASMMLLRAAIHDEDDKEVKGYYKSTLYFASRLQSELLFYVDWQGAYQLMRSPAATLTLLDNSYSLIKQAGEDMLWNVPFGDGFEKFERGPFKDRSKLGKRTLDMIPGVNGILKTFTVPERANLYSR